jgi:predicted HicB family RNase H-like nuclease
MTDSDGYSLYQPVRTRVRALTGEPEKSVTKRHVSSALDEQTGERPKRTCSHYHPKRAILAVRLQPHLKRLVEAKAKRLGVSMTDLVEPYLAPLLARLNGAPK